MAQNSKKTSNVKKETKRLVLLDAHAILHRGYHALPAFATTKGEPTGALYGLSTILVKLIGDLKPDYIAACYDLPEPTHRHEAYDEYKMGRKAADEELVSQIINSREIFAAFGIPMYEAVGFEADDVLGTVAEQFKGRNDVDIVIASGDMDTLQLVDDKHVKVYTMKKGIQDTVMYDEDAVNARFGFGPKLLPDYKGLAGDASDNIPGVQGIGDKTATQLIQAFGSIEKIYKTLKKTPEKFEEAGIKKRAMTLLEENKDEAEFSKMLATIRTDAPVEFALPEREWRESIDFEKTREVFQRFEFRNLEQRLREVIATEDEKLKLQEEKDEQEAARADEIDKMNGGGIDPRELTETAIALWLVTSSLTSPSLEDILSHTNTTSFPEAKEEIFRRLNESGLERVFTDIEKPAIPIVQSMSRRGITIDREYLKKLSEEYHEELTTIERQIHKLAGHEFNINSPKQLGEVLFDEMNLAPKNHRKTSTGARSTAESELRKLEGEHEIIDLILQYRELSKLLGTYIDAIPPMLDTDSRLHAEFLQAGTTTGRMASQNPNLQNIPIRTELGRAIRNAFIASKGYTLAALDYSQIELRVAAFLSGDEKLVKAFAEGEDIHTAVAAEVFEVPLESVDKEMRRKAKVINFGILYGMGVNALKQNLGTDRAEAQQFYNRYFEKFSGLAAYLERLKGEAHERGYSETYFGRRRYFEGLDSRLPQVRAGAERMAINAPIQGTAADILKIAMTRVDELLNERKDKKQTYLLLQVHDELVYEVPEEYAGEIVPAIKQAMESVMSEEETKGVPLAADAEIGKNWGEME
ncbi:MAG: DNA polymerase [Candidatus Paceibacterota bacterium]